VAGSVKVKATEKQPTSLSGVQKKIAEKNQLTCWTRLFIAGLTNLGLASIFISLLIHYNVDLSKLFSLNSLTFT